MGLRRVIRMRTRRLAGGRVARYRVGIDGVPAGLILATPGWGFRAVGLVPCGVAGLPGAVDLGYYATKDAAVLAVAKTRGMG